MLAYYQHIAAQVARSPSVSPHSTCPHTRSPSATTGPPRVPLLLADGLDRINYLCIIVTIGFMRMTATQRDHTTDFSTCTGILLSYVGQSSNGSPSKVAVPASSVPKSPSIARASLSTDTTLEPNVGRMLFWEDRALLSARSQKGELLVPVNECTGKRRRRRLTLMESILR